MSFSFATCVRKTALEYLNVIYDKGITDAPDSAGPFLDFVEKDIVRVQDPMMHSPAQVIAGTHWSDDKRDDVVDACKVFHDTR